MDQHQPAVVPQGERPLVAATARNRRRALLGIVAPMALCCGMLRHFLSPLPVADDYDTVLVLCDRLQTLHGGWAWLQAVLFTQHNEYKLVYGNAVTALQFALFGHPNLQALSLLGDAQLLALAWLLWRCFLPRQVRGTDRLALFVPVSLLLFAVNFSETLNWSMAAFQNLGVLLFGLLALLLAAGDGPWAVAASCAAFACSIASSGNGFLLLPAGALLFAQGRQWRRLAAWVLTAAACALLYAHGYTRAATQGGPHRFSLSFALSFLGSFAAVRLPVVRLFSIPAGLAMLLCAAVAVRRGYLRTNPVVSAFAAFLLLTSLAVSALRGGLGYDQSLSSRYRIYSDLLLVCLYCFGAGELLRRARLHSLRHGEPWPRLLPAYRAMLVAAAVLFAVGTALGGRLLWLRERALVAGMQVYRQSSGSDGPVLLGPQQNSAERAAENARFRSILRAAERDGVWSAP